MASPSLRARVDKQGRLVLPHQLREGLVTIPGDVLLTRTPDGLLLQPMSAAGVVSIAIDGLPVLALEHTVSNEHVLAAIDAERGER